MQNQMQSLLMNQMHDPCIYVGSVLLSTIEYSPCKSLSFAGSPAPTYGFFHAPESSKDQVKALCVALVIEWQLVN
jgi:hypothetical protein